MSVTFLLCFSCQGRIAEMCSDGPMIVPLEIIIEHLLIRCLFTISLIFADVYVCLHQERAPFGDLRVMPQLSSILPNVQGTCSLNKASTRQQLRATQSLPRSFSTSKLGRHRNSSRYNLPMRAALDPSALGELVGSDQVLAPVMGALDPAFGALVGIVREVCLHDL